MDFHQKIIEIDEHTSKEQKKNIHFKSLSNFIYYYDSTKKEKIRITKLLEGYINFIEKKSYSLTDEDSKEAYNEYVYPLGMQYYRRYLNFSADLPFGGFIIFCVLPNICAWFFTDLEIIKSVVLFFTLSYLANYFFKLYKKKIYGYQY